MKSTLLVLALALIPFFFSKPVQAEFYRLQELVGPAPGYNSDPIIVHFDLGQEFSEIRNVLIVVEATVTPLTYQSCGRLLKPQPCELVSRNVGFWARLDDGEGYFTSAVLKDFHSDWPTQQAAVFDRLFLDFSFDNLLDGQGTLTLYWNGIYFIGDAIVQDINPPTGTIFEASLVVDGVPVPAPSQALQLAVGILFLTFLPHGRGARSHAV